MADRRGGNSGLIILLVIAVLAVVAAFAFGLIDVDQTKEASLPDVDVSAEGGQAPAFDVETGEVVVGTTKEQVEVPEVDVTTDTETVDTPAIGVRPADEEN